MKMKSGKLFIVATPIGNYQDITLRALDVLRTVDAVICEELRLGSTLLKKTGISNKPLLTLNEHNEDEQTGEILLRLHRGETLSLISDCGTPGFEDPGARLVQEALQQGIQVIPLPGPSSLMAAISISPIPLKEFLFAGFLPRKDEERISKLKRLQALKIHLVLMDTPYRLRKLLEEVESIFGKHRQATLALDVSLPGELILYADLSEIRQRVQSRKGEFVLIIYC
jgi:16S rRNA (cytidine1402-2'-O)-methyltransferase